MRPFSDGPGVPAHETAQARRERLRALAGEVEAEFLAEMLGAAGLDAALGAFGGGAGEEQFSSFLRREQARLMVKAGGIGLAQQIFESLLRREGPVVDRRGE
ncbi:rod-binding protein [Meinhardsimonia xiamenensis]|jgi:Rod binding domain-containing protein|nr:rod-binding protein [Meinhardsimonia xiamenensis]